jgi:hypothetical protein
MDATNHKRIRNAMQRIDEVAMRVLFRFIVVCVFYYFFEEGKHSDFFLFVFVSQAEIFHIKHRGKKKRQEEEDA